MEMTLNTRDYPILQQLLHYLQDAEIDRPAAAETYAQYGYLADFYGPRLQMPEKEFIMRLETEFPQYYLKEWDCYVYNTQA